MITELKLRYPLFVIVTADAQLQTFGNDDDRSICIFQTRELAELFLEQPNQGLQLKEMSRGGLMYYLMTQPTIKFVNWNATVKGDSQLITRDWFRRLLALNQ